MSFDVLDWCCSNWKFYSNSIEICIDVFEDVTIQISLDWGLIVFVYVFEHSSSFVLISLSSRKEYAFVIILVALQVVVGCVCFD